MSHFLFGGRLGSPFRYLLDILCHMIEASHETIPLSGGKKTHNSDSDESCDINRNVVGWKQEIEPYRQDSLFWYAVWISDGQPNRGALHDVMCWSRNKYHYAIRKVKKLSDQIRAEKLLEAANCGEANLLKEMKNIKGVQKKGQSLKEAQAKKHGNHKRQRAGIGPWQRAGAGPRQRIGAGP